jgi:photosystem II stability/assembly factor-like uncharacterized protein
MRFAVLMTSIAGIAAASTLAWGAATAPDTFKDPLQLAAPINTLATSSQLSGVAVAGKRLIAVGVNGLIIASDDDAKTWKQMSAPVSSDLTAVYFATAQQGWAVGQDGVVLHSADGGNSWTKQFDGLMAKEQLTAHFKKLAAAGDPVGDRMLPNVDLNYADGPEQALLDVWFDDALNGYVVGSFGSLFATHDGGKSWESMIENVDTDQLYHYNAIRRIGGSLFIASEQGMVFKFDPQSGHFVQKNTGYAGSFFSLAGDGNTVVAFGLRGAAYRSADAGENWEVLPSASGGSVSASLYQAGRLLVVTRNGLLVTSSDQGSSFKPLPVPRPMMLTCVVEANNVITVVGTRGVQRIGLQ